MTHAERTVVTVNGEPRPVATLRLYDLLAELGYRPDQPGLAVAVNGEVVRRAEWARRELSAGDVLDVVGAVQGG